MYVLFVFTFVVLFIYCISLFLSIVCVCVCVCVCARARSVTQSCPTLCDHTDCSTPGSFVHGIFPARILEHVFIFYSGDLPNPGIKSGFLVSPALAGRFFTAAPPGSPDIEVPHCIFLSRSTSIYNSFYYYVFGCCVVWYFITFLCQLWLLSLHN